MRRARGAARRTREAASRAVRASPLGSLWPPHSRLFVVGDRADWVLSREAEEIARIGRRLGIAVGRPILADYVRAQSIFYTDQFALTRPRFPPPSRVGIAYFHGRPGTPGAPEFDAVFARLRAVHEQLARVQVSHSQGRDVVLASGVAPEKVFTIPIGIALELFPRRTPADRDAARARYGVPASAFVVGSFVKDGIGWGKGLEPKLVKGPDVLLETLARLRKRVPELFVLLSGPARGFVRRGLERLGVPHQHVAVADYAQMSHLYHASDAVVVPSRQEGGPKALLEAMASGVPVVTTRVGQAMDLVRHGENAFMVEVEDVEGLAHWLAAVAAGSPEMDGVVENARRTADDNSYAAQLPLWREFFRGFVSLPA